LRPGADEFLLNYMKQQLTGTVVSDKMQKTAVVKVARLKEHPKYHKRYSVSKKYKAHDEQKICHIGDTVVIEACKPMSADKHWKVIKRLSNKPKTDDNMSEKAPSNGSIEI
jgi:small subunit ribosomal protein S17